MAYPSIIDEMPSPDSGAIVEAPEFFGDLNIDQIVAAITAGKEEYNLLPYFHRPLATVAAVRFRHEVWRDLEDRALSMHVRSFAARMHAIRQRLAQLAKLSFELQKQIWFLEEADLYHDAVTVFVRDLEPIALTSRALQAFRRYLTEYVRTDSFRELAAEIRRLKGELATIKYAVTVGEGSFTVRPYDDESNYSIEVARTFEKFKQGAVKGYSAKFSDFAGMNHIEAKVLEFVARLYPEVFSSLSQFCAKRAGFLDEAIVAFDRDIQFYVAYQDYMATFQGAGLGFCYPAVSAEDKTERSTGHFDVALAGKLIAEKRPVIRNDFELRGAERIIVVSGPNQGGKTTFARTFGQLHYFASLGCPVPGTEAQLFLCDRLFTHFEREEDISTLRGKLEDDLVRIHALLAEATSRSIIVMNEIFTSTTLDDAVLLGKSIMRRISDLDAICVCVTFIDELASLDGKTVSMVSTVVPDDPAVRTFKVVRRPADGLSYAISIAEKYSLTYERLKERIHS